MNLSKRCQVKDTINTASLEEKDAFKKRSPRYLWISILKNKEQEQDSGFTVESSDESFFFYDSLVRRVWIDEKKRPIVRVTGSHKHSCIFGAIRLGGKQLFKQYDKFNGDTFLDYLKKIHAKFRKCYLFMDKASPHHKSKKVQKYFEQNKYTLIPIYLLNCINGVYGYRRDMEYSQCDSICSAILSIICGFKKQDIQVFQNKKIWS